MSYWFHLLCHFWVWFCSLLCPLGVCVFFTLFNMPYNFLLEAGHDVMDKRNWDNHAFSVSSYVNLLWPELWLMFAAAVGTIGYSFLVLVCVLPYFCGFLKNSFLNTVCVAAFSHNPLLLYWSPVHVLVRYWGRKAFYNLMIKS